MNKKNSISLNEVLDNIHLYRCFDLYMNTNDKTFSENNIQIIEELDEDKLEIMGLEYIFGVHILEDILENLSQQKKSFNLRDVVDAIKFYYENDAFMEF